MRTVCSVAFVLSALLSSAALGATSNYKIVDRIKVPDGGFDCATFDPATGHVLMARTDFTTVIDVKTAKVSQLTGAARAHMAVPIPGTTLIAMPQREGKFRIVDMATDMVLADVLMARSERQVGDTGAAHDA